MKTNQLQHFITLLFIASLLGQPRQVKANVITFENIPGMGAPTDGMTIHSQFEPLYGVTFSLVGGGFPLLAQIGGPLTAFSGYDDGINSRNDRPAPGSGTGSFFLTDDGIVGGPPPVDLIVTYTHPVSAASGIVLDIDVNEQWRVQARDNLGNVFDEVILPPNPLVDGSATSWSFDHNGTADIYSILFKFDGTAGGGVAFDNFSSVPEPSSTVLILSGAVLGLRRRSRRTHQPNA